MLTLLNQLSAFPFTQTRLIVLADVSEVHQRTGGCAPACVCMAAKHSQDNLGVRTRWSGSCICTGSHPGGVWMAAHAQVQQISSVNLFKWARENNKRKEWGSRASSLMCACMCVCISFSISLFFFPHLTCFFTFANETICMAEEEEGNGDEGRRQWRWKKKEGGEGREGRVGGGGKRERCSSEQTECPQTETHGARAIPTLPRWLPPEVVLCRTNPEPRSAFLRHGWHAKTLSRLYPSANKAREI